MLDVLVRVLVDVEDFENCCSCSSTWRWTSSWTRRPSCSSWCSFARRRRDGRRREGDSFREHRRD